jgi:porin-like protein
VRFGRLLTMMQEGVAATPAGFASGAIQATAAGANAYGGTHAPDIVGNVRVDQAWGLFQISGMAHLINASYNILSVGGLPNALSEISGHPEDKWGGAVMAALQIKNLPTGAGDDFKVDVSYAKGVTKQVISTSGPSPSFAMFGGTDRPGAYQSIGFGQTADGVYLPGFLTGGATGDIKLVDSWGIRGAFNHNWDPYWSSSLFGSYAQVRYGGNATDILTAKGQFCASFNFGKALSTDYSCNPDFNVAQVGVTTRWTPVKNLTFSAEVGAFFLDQKFTGAATLTPTSPKPTAVYEFKDQSTVYMQVQARRNF